MNIDLKTLIGKLSDVSRIAATHAAVSATTTRWWKRCWCAASKLIPARAMSTVF
jgi:hypothetical protein